MEEGETKKPFPASFGPAIHRPVTRKGAVVAKPRLNFFYPLLERYVGHFFKTIGHSLKNWASLRKFFTPLVSQGGYGPGSALACNV